MTKKSFWRRGEDDAKKVSSELIDQIKRGEALRGRAVEIENLRDRASLN